MTTIFALFRKILIVVVLSALILAMGGYAYYHLPCDDRMRPVRVVIPEGATLAQTAALLQDGGVVRLPLLFTGMARLLGKDRSIRAGEYSLNSSMSPRVILQRLCKGEVTLHKVTVPEGWTVRQVAALLESMGFASREAIMEETPEVGRDLGLPGGGLEGYLFPDTYYFAMGLSPVEILKAMVHRFNTVYGPDLRARQAEKGMDLKEVVTLASIVEKETGCKEERPLIASVLMNRLRKGIPLQCDPTVIYGIENFDGNLTKEQLQTPGPYNTYLNRGLPPGPICNPGLDSLRAVLYPADTPYLYFVSRNDGTHVFSPTLEEHNRAVEKYQKRHGKSSGAGR